MSKKAIAALVIVGVGLGSFISLTADTINIKELDSEKLERTMPSQGQNSILSYNDAIKDAKNSVVNISTQKAVKTKQMMNPFMNDPFFREFFGKNFGQTMPKERLERSLGSGVIISTDGYIITNNHVVDGADKIIVTLPNDKKEHEAKLIGSDPKSDIAVIKIKLDKLPAIAFADSSKAKEGDVVFAIGNPFGVGETITHGIISALNKSGLGIHDYENFIQTDASINPGNSGGALIDSRGALVGINTAIISQSGTSAGVGFAIPSNMAKSIAKQLVEKGKIERGFLGIVMGELDGAKQKYYGVSKGAVVVDVSADMPAAKAGVKRGDLIVGVDGKTIESPSELRNIVGTTPPDTTMKVDIIRDKKKMQLSIKLAKQPDSVASADEESTLGAKVSNATQENRNKYGILKNVTGAVVESVKDDSIASKAGLTQGDVIVQIEDKTIENVDDLQAALKEYGSMEAKRIYVNRRGQSFMVIVEK